MWSSSSAVRVGVDVEVSIELGDEVGVADRIVVEDGDVAGGLVGDVDLVSLSTRRIERAAHGDDVVVGVGGEDEDALGEELVAWRSRVAGATFGSVCRRASR